MPVGAYGARREIMETVSPLGPMYQAGTLSGNPVAMAAGIATLDELKRPGRYEELESKAQRLEEGFRRAFAQAETPLQINRVGSMMTLFFNESRVTGWSSVSESDGDGFAPVLPPHVGGRGIPTSVALRGHVRLHGPRRDGYRRNHRGRRAGAQVALQAHTPRQLLDPGRLDSVRRGLAWWDVAR